MLANTKVDIIETSQAKTITGDYNSVSNIVATGIKSRIEDYTPTTPVSYKGFEYQKGYLVHFWSNFDLIKEGNFIKDLNSNKEYELASIKSGSLGNKRIYKMEVFCIVLNDDRYLNHNINM